jgi:serine/threonine-protein kinase
MLRKLEKYEIVEEIGHGGMATVYRAIDTVLDRPVALKVMHPHLRAAEEARRRFHREARSVARLRHPRVLEIYDFSGERSTEAYIAAELLTGPTLKHWREQQHDVLAEIAACFAIEIARALEAAHAAGIVHRDVKPENVLLHENRELKLTDFGIADMIDAQSMTATGQILGSPGHMAPEQIEGKDCDARTDLFSLGTVLYYLATGNLPFTGRNPHQVLKRIVDGEYADPLRVNPAIGGRLRAIIVKALERDPGERYQTAREMIADLEAFIAEAGITDAEAMLERYLRDPEAVSAELRAQIIERLIERGARASDAGDVPAALDHYNRVLALDEGNARVLQLIERVGVDRRRRALLLAGAGLAALGALAAMSAWALWPVSAGDEEHGLVGPIESSAATEDAGAEAAPEELGSPSAPDEVEGDAGVALAAGGDADVAAQDAGAAVARVHDPGRVRPSRRPPRAPAVRTVLLQPIPEAVSIGIDGAPPEPFRTVVQPRQVLTVGPHTFTLRPTAGSADEYVSRTFENVMVLPGEGEQILRLQLPFARASVRVRSNVPGTVTITGADAMGVRRTRGRGRTDEVVLVEMLRRSEAVRVTVSAPGYETFESEPLNVVAGGPTRELRVDLREAASAP